MIVDYEAYQDYTPALPLTKTEKLLDKIDRMATVYESGNNWKISSGLLATPGLAGLILGGSLGLNPLIGLAFLCGVSGSIAAWISYAYAESSEAKALPKFGLFTGDHDLLPQLSGLEQTHYLALNRFGVDFVQAIEAYGWLPQLLTAIKDIDLSRVPDDQQDRYHHRSMQKIREVYALPAAPETQQRTPARTPQAQTPRGLSPETVEVSGGSIALPPVRDLADNIASGETHCCIVAKPRSGKSTLLLEIIKASSTSKIYLIDSKGDDLRLRSTAATFLLCNESGKVPPVMNLFREIESELIARQSGAEKYPITLIVDEINMLRFAINAHDSKELEEFTEILIRLLWQGLSAGVKVVFSSHSSRCKTLGIDTAMLDALSFVSLGRNRKYESLEDLLEHQISGRKSRKLQEYLDSIATLAIQETLALSTLEGVDFYRLPMVNDSPLSQSQPRDSRELLEFCLDRSTAPPAETRHPTTSTNVSKIDSITDQEIGELMGKILGYATKQGSVTPSQAKANIRFLREYSTTEIKQLFSYLVEDSQGDVNGEIFTPF